jgi:hypothetical protein
MSSKKNQWPKEMLHPRFLPMDKVVVHGIKKPLYGHVLGKEVPFGDNGSECTVVGMLAIEGDAYYQLHFTHPDYEHGFTAGLPAKCLKKPDSPTLCGTCIFWCDDECDYNAEVKNGECSSYEAHDDDDSEWQVGEDTFRCKKCLYYTGDDCDAESNFFHLGGDDCTDFKKDQYWERTDD